MYSGIQNVQISNDNGQKTCMCGFYLSGNRRQILIEIDKIELNMKISRSNEKIRKTKVDNCA